MYELVLRTNDKKLDVCNVIKNNRKRELIYVFEKNENRRLR